MNGLFYIRSAGIVSPAGMGLREFGDALRGGRRPVARPGADAFFSDAHRPPGGAYWIDGFDVRDHLGAKGTSTLDRTTQLAVVACRQALERAGLHPGTADPARTGIVLGTASGSIKSISDFVRSTYTASPPHMVSPMLFPNTVMNCAAAQCAIWTGLRGVNSTVCSGRLSGLAAMKYAARMMALGHASAMVVGAVEEYCDFTAWAHESQARPGDAPVGEGAAMFVVDRDEAAVAPAFADVLSVQLAAVTAGRSPAEVLARCVSRALAQAQADASDLVWWAGEDSRPDAGQSDEHAALRGLGAAAYDRLCSRAIDVAPFIGRCHSASAGFQLAAALAVAPRGLGLITGTSPQGQVGCALVSILAHAERERGLA